MISKFTNIIIGLSSICRACSKKTKLSFLAKRRISYLQKKSKNEILWLIASGRQKGKLTRILEHSYKSGEKLSKSRKFFAGCREIQFDYSLLY